MLFSTFLLAGTASATCLHGLSKFKRQESEETVEVGQFGYTGLLGPFNWAALAPENEACKTGTAQSPINVEEGVIPLAAEAPVVDIPEQAVEFENLGTTIEVVVNGTTSFAGTDFRLRQFHMHTPSEHRIGEEYFPLELHFVHEGVTDPNNLAVISVLFQMSTEASDPVIAGLQPHLAAIANPGTKTAIEAGLDFTSLVEHVQTTPLFQYTGSLTTPPCAEGLTFLITQQPLALDVNTYNEIKSIVKFNSRYTQADHETGANLIEVANKAGTAEQFEAPPVPQPGAEEESASPTVAEEAAGPAITKGQTLVISEIAGQPTSLLAVVA